jgi:hypothetical protein
MKYKADIQRLEDRIADRAEPNPMDQVRDLTAKVQESATKLYNQKGELEKGIVLLGIYSTLNRIYSIDEDCISTKETRDHC